MLEVIQDDDLDNMVNVKVIGVDSDECRETRVLSN